MSKPTTFIELGKGVMKLQAERDELKARVAELEIKLASAEGRLEGTQKSLKYWTDKVKREAEQSK